MKKIAGIVTIAILFCFSFSVLQAQEKAENIYKTNTTVVENTDMADLHARAYNWMTVYFRTDNREALSREIDENYVGLRVESPMKSGDMLNFNIRFNLKDNEYTYTIFELSVPENKEIQKMMDNLDVKIKEVMNPTATQK